MPEIEQSVTEEIEEAFNNDESVDLYDFISQFGTSSPIRVYLERKQPKRWKGIQTAGRLATYEEPIDLDQIEQEHGGGTYQIRINRHIVGKNGKPRWKYERARTFEIAGPPKIEGLMHGEDEPSGNGQSNGDDSVSREAMRMAQNILRDTMDRAESRTGDTEMLGRILEQMASKDDRLMEILLQPRSDGSEKFIDAMQTTVQAESNRLEAVRAQHASELSMLRQQHHTDIENERRSAREDRKFFEKTFEMRFEEARRQHDREIDTLRESARAALESTKQSFEARIDAYKEQLTRAERELAEARTELIQLRAKKDQGPLDQLQNIVQIKTAFETLGLGGGGDEEPKGRIERVIEAVMNSGAAQRIAGNLAGGAPQEEEEQEQEQEQLFPVRMPDGTVKQVPASVIAQARARNAERKKREADPLHQMGVTQNEVQLAVTFMETAYGNQTTPANFAASARNSVPAGILAYLKQHGVDVFLDKVAKLDNNSPLATVAGRKWVYDVAQFLLRGTTEAG